MDIKILYEDEYLLFALKPVGVLSESDSQNSVLTLLKDALGKDVYPVHRLDRDVGGVMVFAKTAECAAALSSMVAKNLIEKRYIAVVCGTPEQSGIFEDLLFKDSSKNKTYVVKRKRKGVREAKLEYELKGTLKDGEKELSLVEIKLHTGRTHQIRVQFSSRKMPVLGDGRYGGKSSKCKIALRSYQVSFEHPFKKEQICIRSDAPDEYPWNLFN